MAQIDEHLVELRKLVDAFNRREPFGDTEVDRTQRLMGRVCRRSKDYPKGPFSCLCMVMVESGRRCQKADVLREVARRRKKKAKRPPDLPPSPPGFPEARWNELYDACFLFFYRKTMPQTLLYFWKKGLREDLREDVVLRTYEKMHENIETIGAGAFGWFWKVLRTTYLDYLKKERTDQARDKKWHDQNIRPEDAAAGRNIVGSCAPGPAASIRVENDDEEDPDQ